MRIVTILCCLSVFFASCNSGEKIPDVSNIKVDITTERFEKDFFKLDTANPIDALKKLQEKYPDFSSYYYERVLGIDGSGNAGNAISPFLFSYRSIYDSVQLIFSDFSKYENEIKKGLQFVKYYFPSYKLPSKIITFIGPLDASYKTSFGLQGDIITNDAIGIGLQLHLGKDFSFYKSEQGIQMYPEYISNRFEPGTIAVNALRNITDDLYPEKTDDKPLVQQMVEKGKRLYLLQKFLPYAEEYKLIGYTTEQFKQAIAHEKEIWNMFVQNGSLQSIDENIIKNYIGESPKTQELGNASPGNIGSFAGWQIVKKYMLKNPEITLQKLMATDADTIFQEAKYKP
jgi:hypothetical protein